MLLTITTTHTPATDLGYLLHKHPDRVQAFSLPFGTAHVLYPEATGARCTAALLLDIDPVGLVRRGDGRGTFALAEFVNDRPYVASSFLSVAMNAVYKSAMAGTCVPRPELAATAIPLEGRTCDLPIIDNRVRSGPSQRRPAGFEPANLRLRGAVLFRAELRTYGVDSAPAGLEPAASRSTTGRPDRWTTRACRCGRRPGVGAAPCFL